MELELKRIGQLIAPWGGTRTSVEFFRKYREAFGEVVKAEVTGDVECGLILTNVNGEQMILHQCNAGYGGEGPNGTKKILLEAGFDKEEVESKVHSLECFEISK
jgi:hypothetical protein